MPDCGPSRNNLAPTALSGLTEEQRLEAMERFAVLRPHIEEGVPLTRAAADDGVPLRSARRWLARYRSGGLPVLGRQARSDQGERRLPRELVTFIEGIYLRRPPLSVATVHRMACDVAIAKGWHEPAYRTVLNIARALDPALVGLAQGGDKAYREAFELIYRREANRSNAMWQADHTGVIVKSCGSTFLITRRPPLHPAQPASRLRTLRLPPPGRRGAVR